MRSLQQLRISSPILFLGLGFSAGLIFTFLALSLVKKHDPPPVAPPPLVEPQAPPAWQTPEAAEVSPETESPLGNEMSLQSVQDDLRSGPIPLEWEDPLFAVLDTEDMDRRNSGLIQMATVTARQVPRVQAECLAHLTYGLEEKDYPQFLALIRNPGLPLESRMQFLEETLKIRRPEFSEWLAKNLANDPQPEISEAARRFLAEARTNATHSEKETNGPF